MKKVSFVIPCYCSAKSLDGVIEEICATMERLDEYDYEIILIDDASPDCTWEKIGQIIKNNEKVQGIRFARNFGQHSALMAGFRHVQGDIVVCLDDDGQTPADEVPEFIRKIENGADVVYASYLNKHHSSFRNLGSRINSKMTEWLLEKPQNLYVSSYFATKRFIIEEVVKYENSYPYVLGLVLRTTKRIENVEVEHRDRLQGKSGYSFGKLISLWVNGFTTFSVKPLRLATFSGVAVAVMGIIYTLFTIIKKFLDPTVPLGWSSTMAVLLILGGMILFVLGMIGEYVGRIYMCINNSPQYVIKERMNTQKD